MSVQVNHLTKIYGSQRAVDDVSFSVGKGQILGFLGPNGAGKTTTMKMITTYIPADAGTVTVSGHAVDKEPMQVRRIIGYLPENNPLYLDMYVKEYLHFIAGLHQLNGNGKKRIAEMIELTGLGLEQTKKIGQLSKGYRQRVGLAQALLHDPEVLILDEPTSGLDPNQLVDIRNLIRMMGREKTVILSTHIMQEVQAMCDRVVIINRGRIVADDKTENLQQRISGGSIIAVEFKEAVKEEELLAIAGVKSATSREGGRWHLSAEAGKDIREDIFLFAKDKNLTLLGMQKEQQSIEEVFQQLTKERS